MIIIEENDEFTWDMVKGLPVLNWYITNKNPKEVKIKCKKGIASIYKTIHEDVLDEFNTHREDGRLHSETYSHELPNFTKQTWLPPNLKEIFKGKLQFKKPSLVIQNKYAIEWGGPPSNFISIETLDKIFLKYKEKYQIIYIRPKGKSKDYFEDFNQILNFKDYELISEKHPEVITIYDLLDKHNDLDFNTMQFAIHATSNKHISVSGGNACLSAYFGGDLIIFDNKNSLHPNRGIWKTDSWLKHLGGSNIYGVKTYEELIKKTDIIF